MINIQGYSYVEIESSIFRSNFAEYGAAIRGTSYELLSITSSSFIGN